MNSQRRGIALKVKCWNSAGVSDTSSMLEIGRDEQIWGQKWANSVLHSSDFRFFLFHTWLCILVAHLKGAIEAAWHCQFKQSLFAWLILYTITPPPPLSLLLSQKDFSLVDKSFESVKENQACSCYSIFYFSSHKFLRKTKQQFCFLDVLCAFRRR